MKVLDSYPFLDDQLVQQVLEGLTSEAVFKANSGAKVVEESIRQGHLRKAARVTMGNGVVEIDNEASKKLQDLHPPSSSTGAPFPLDLRPNTSNSMRVDNELFKKEEMDKVVNSLPRDSAPGVSGWTFEMIQDAFGAKCPKFRKAIHHFCVCLIRGKKELIPLRQWITSCRLIALKKENGGVRPIAISESFTRFCFRWALKCMGVKSKVEPEQFGVGSIGGTEPIVFRIAAGLESGCDEGLISVDFHNAFNTISRHEMARIVADKLPDLFHGVKFLYGETSDLLSINTNSQIIVTKSCEGVRQGDPLGPLLFTLTISPLIKKLKEKFGDVCAYLDDIFIFAKPSMIDEVKEYLGSEEISKKYNLRLNRDKTVGWSRQDLRDQPRKILGTMVGGSDIAGDNKLSCNFVKEVAHRLQDKVRLLDNISLQGRLMVLRLCFLPQLNHLLRTIHPNLTNEGSSLFDKIIEDTVASYAGHPDPVNFDQFPLSKQIVHLSVKRGGLGFHSQNSIREVAFASALVLARSVLTSRGYQFSIRPSWNGFVDQCALNLNLPVDTLLTDTEARRPHLQNRASAIVQEKLWLDCYENTENKLHLRKLFTENACLLARSLHHSIPYHFQTTMNDDVCYYVLRRTLLLPICQLNDSTICSCGQYSTTMHHLDCAHNNAMRTYRHSECVKILCKFMKQLGGAMILPEFSEGNLRHDIYATGNGLHRQMIDVGIASVRASTVPKWPTDDQVAEWIGGNGTSDCSSGDNLQDIEDDSNTTNSEVIRIRTLRTLASEVCVSRDINTMTTRKINHFESEYKAPPFADRGTFVTFVLTAGGGISVKAEDVIRMVLREKRASLRVRQRLRRDIIFRLSTTLARYACQMALDTSKRSLDV